MTYRSNAVYCNCKIAVGNGSIPGFDRPQRFTKIEKTYSISMFTSLTVTVFFAVFFAALTLIRTLLNRQNQTAILNRKYFSLVDELHNRS